MGDQIVVLFVSIGLIALGLYFIFGKKSSHKSNRVMVEATIVDQVTESDSSGNGSTPGQNSTVSTYPVYEYTLNGRTYRTTGTVGITVFSKEKCAVGARAMIHVNPERPNRVYTHEEQNTTAVIGGILVFLGLMTLLILI